MTAPCKKRLAHGAFFLLALCALLVGDSILGLSKITASLNRLLGQENGLLPKTNKHDAAKRLSLPEITKSYATY